MLAPRRLGLPKRHYPARCLAEIQLQRGTARTRNVALREQNRRAVQTELSLAKIIDEDFDELECSPAIFLKLANQI